MTEKDKKKSIKDIEKKIKESWVRMSVAACSMLRRGDFMSRDLVAGAGWGSPAPARRACPKLQKQDGKKKQTLTDEEVWELEDPPPPRRVPVAARSEETVCLRTSSTSSRRA